MPFRHADVKALQEELEEKENEIRWLKKEAVKNLKQSKKKKRARRLRRLYTMITSKLLSAIVATLIILAVVGMGFWIYNDVVYARAVNQTACETNLPRVCQSPPRYREARRMVTTCYCETEGREVLTYNRLIHLEDE